RHAFSRLEGIYHVPAGEEHRRGDAYVDPEHPYASDLDLYGPSSLFEQLNTTQTPGGEAMLAGWLAAPAAPDEIAARQRAARELSNHDRLREDMAVAGMRAGKIDRDAAPFLAWAKQRPVMSAGSFYAALALASLTVVLLIATGFMEPPWSRAWLVGVGAQVVLIVALRARVEAVLAPVCVKQSPLSTYQDLMRIVEAHDFEDDRLRGLQAQLREPTRASEQMERLERLVGLASVRHNALVQVLADIFLSWDVWCAYLLDRWRARHGARVADWLEALSEIEALASLATFAREHPDYVWPRVADGATRFGGREIGHPLIVAERRVDNDAALSDGVRALMITGSNMSGKSTMLRSMGLGAVLAQAGAPVCAAELTMSPVRVFTSMRVGDALDRGVSRFYMEVEKLKRIVDALDEAGAPVMFLLDEVLHGTNSRERIIGAKAVVRYLVEHGAIGAVSSHDLGLVELERLTDGKVKNVHFEDHIENGRMCFDYRMKAGAVSTSNALRLMRDVGLTVPGLSDEDA
ncbi:MAG TPA: DNA mismatch repair protein MutS, partial [Polyangiaceae bacterium]|nr:DNA mismatch repair protein MutS [Polyangiaceae bacterium]